MQSSIVTVYGASNPAPDSRAYAEAERVGRALGKAGYAVMTGGYFGTMEAVSKGAKSTGAHVIGVTVSLFEGPDKRPGANAYCDEVVRYDALCDRLCHLATRCDAAVALPGGIGTLSEVALTWSLIQAGEIGPRPFILYSDGWSDLLHRFYGEGEYIAERHMRLWQIAHTPEEIITLLKNWKHE